MTIWTRWVKIHGPAHAVRFSFLQLQRRSFASQHESPRVLDLLQPRGRTYTDKSLNLNGFIHSVRKQKRIAFAAFGDGSCIETIQVVLTPEQAEQLTNGAAVSVEGRWVVSYGKEQSNELQAAKVTVLGDNDVTTNPIQKKYQTSEYLRGFPHLRARLPFNALLLRLRSQVIADTTFFFNDRGYVQVHTPVITSSDCEGAGEVFSLQPALKNSPTESVNLAGDEPYFREPKYLTVSAQLHLEALAQSVGRVWTLSPTFRAERSSTPRHLSEFYMLEAEMAFISDQNMVMNILEELLRAISLHLQASRVGHELLQAHDQRDRALGMQADELKRRWAGISNPSWPRIKYQDAMSFLQQAVSIGRANFEAPPLFELGLQTEHEKYIASEVGQGAPVFVTDYPQQIKPFYMPPSNQHSRDPSLPSTVACFDLLVPDICELAGGSLREHRFDNLKQSMQEMGIDLAGLEWYLDLRRYGSVGHGGFGLGFDRLLAYLSGVANVRDVVTFPRYYGRCVC